MGFKLPKGITKVVKTAKKIVGDPNVLTAAGCVLFVVTVIEAVKVTPKVQEILEENKDASLLEKVVAVAKEEPGVVKAAATGAAAIGCVVASNRVAADRIATMGAAYEMSKTAFAEYKNQIKEQLGLEKATDLDKSIAESSLHNMLSDERKIINTGHGEQLFYFEHTGQLFRSSGNFVERMFNDLNRKLQDEFSVTVPEFQRDLGLPVVEGFKHTGWNVDALPSGKVEYSFEPYMNEDNQTVVRIVLDYSCEPKPVYNSIWGASR